MKTERKMNERKNIIEKEKQIKKKKNMKNEKRRNLKWLKKK